MAETKWTVNFLESFETLLDPDKLKNGQVDPAVQAAIKGAIRHAVVTTLESHGLLPRSQNVTFGGVDPKVGHEAEWDEENPVKPPPPPGGGD